jgi:hypothetical protein
MVHIRVSVLATFATLVLTMTPVMATPISSLNSNVLESRGV